MDIREVLIAGAFLLVLVIVKTVIRRMVGSLRSGGSENERADWARRRMLRDEKRRARSRDRH